MYGCTGAYIKKMARQANIQLPAKRKINPTETFNKDRNPHYCIYCGKKLTYKHKFCNATC